MDSPSSAKSYQGCGMKDLPTGKQLCENALRARMPWAQVIKFPVKLYSSLVSVYTSFNTFQIRRITSCHPLDNTGNVNVIGKGKSFSRYLKMKKKNKIPIYM